MQRNFSSGGERDSSRLRLVISSPAFASRLPHAVCRDKQTTGMERGGQVQT
jgi:hypothetical protein